MSLNSEILELAKTMNLRQIAERVSLPQSKVRWVLRKHGVRTRCGWERKIAEARVICNHSKKYGQASAAKHFKITIHQVKQAARRVKSQRERVTIAISNEDVNTLRSRAIAYARKKRFSAYLSEDFGSFCTIRLFSGQLDYSPKAERLFITSIFAEWQRDVLGETGARNHEKHESQLDDLSNVAATPHDSVTNELWASIPKGVDGLAFSCVYRYGIPMREVGVYLGLSESMVSRMCSKVALELRKEAV